MSLLLSLETTAHTFSCALHKNGIPISFIEVEEVQSTASKLAPMVEILFKQSKIDQSQLSGVVVSAGPGSYTGLRIGTATAKGICYALNIPLISINSLLSMAHQVVNDSKFSFNEVDLFCPMLDARRMEVYCMLVDRNLEILSKTESKVLNENSFEGFFENRNICFFGDGSEKFKSVVKNPKAKFIRGIKPSASVLGKLGWQKFLAKEFENLEKYEPFYLKDFVIKKPNLVP